ncbi:hypothetical protein KUTeg_002363 [Tegillarca granosa]|uniref:Uncharacterized protein n=1 Tax=Tegillarca granosa TaxID=220873 RepID=A0ABQ9FVJ3_TEGGR|nr:hypothetical protein KUTeg_002363 [Tegillarca granosa]
MLKFLGYLPEKQKFDNLFCEFFPSINCITSDIYWEASRKLEIFCKTGSPVMVRYRLYQGRKHRSSTMIHFLHRNKILRVIKGCILLFWHQKGLRMFQVDLGQYNKTDCPCLEEKQNAIPDRAEMKNMFGLSEKVSKLGVRYVIDRRLASKSIMGRNVASDTKGNKKYHWSTDSFKINTKKKTNKKTYAKLLFLKFDILAFLKILRKIGFHNEKKEGEGKKRTTDFSSTFAYLVGLLEKNTKTYIYSVFVTFLITIDNVKALYTLNSKKTHPSSLLPVCIQEEFIRKSTGMSQNKLFNKVRKAVLSVKIRVWDKTFKLRFRKKNSNQNGPEFAQWEKFTPFVKITFGKNYICGIQIQSDPKGKSHGLSSSADLAGPLFSHSRLIANNIINWSSGLFDGDCKMNDSTDQSIDGEISADEKLRSLGHHKHQQIKTADKTQLNNDIEERVVQQSTNQKDETPSQQKIGTTDIEEMAERKVYNRQGRKDQQGSSNVSTMEKLAIKQRSRSAGPAGRLKPRNSMDERKIISNQDKQKASSLGNSQSARHSMCAEPLSDDGMFPEDSSTDVADSDENSPKKWVKNPLMLKKKQKLDKRKSFQNGETVNAGNKENNLKPEVPSRKPVTRSPQISSRDTYVYQEKSNGQKAKYQKLEERRNRRVDMTVTSDEELNSPQVRISRLRQRALQEAKISTRLPDYLDESVYKQTEQKVCSMGLSSEELPVLISSLLCIGD